MTSEYAVLKGALALAIPTKFKQSLSYLKNDSNSLIWKSYNSKNKIWFHCELLLPNLELIKTVIKKLEKFTFYITFCKKNKSKFFK